MKLVTAFLGLGSNLGNRAGYLEDALQSLDAHQCIRILARSSMYDTDPVGEIAQPNFLNMVVEIETSLPPPELLELCLTIEESNGRVRSVKWGPRTLDIDILFYSNKIIEIDGLRIPHPEAHRRLFVVKPMAEIAESFNHPVLNEQISSILQLL
ncbi:MAG: 2-amino-4-hydroxy-6-hydroxymethyldihydropteridine diphosphokinase [Phycisphaerae bacterium]|jgi:2-amino-4-hydroxy-6-hydroxymethyldihydropteridine diphosphokinase|nr:2-amino-4-hydroxy-6-hydroxymethyldihydropteridine diphosphokinase [Phycisphaerae bacterium]MBT6269099.1 2-amino-4-hydroxy-6-hydroxymethyldihydropteridine diphosphokinase [Phycisphaerae bacterium]MBT6282685.1 2-amino-4-hydroxy-6-hydroxymethyldihydropteridine diphosphokinase [Phycisphaerae bacterium]